MESTQTDYYHFEWDVYIPTAVEKYAVYWRTGILVGIVGFAAFLFRVWNNQLGLKSLEFWWLLVFFTMLIVSVLGYFWHKLSRYGKKNVKRFGVNQDQLTVDNKMLPMAELDKAGVLAYIGEKVDMSRSWKEAGTWEGEVESWVVPTTSHPVTVIFPNLRIKLRFFEALKGYLK